MFNSQLTNKLTCDFIKTSVYPAKGRTKVDSAAQKCLRRSRMEGYGPRPRRPARDWPVPLSYHRPARRRAREPGPQAIGQASVRRPWGLFEIGNFATFSQFLTH